MLPLLLCFLLSSEDQPNSLKSGKDLQTALATNVRWSSIGVEVSRQLRDLQSQSEVAILRDRRIDPRRLVRVETEFVPRVQVLKQISDAIPNTAFCITDNYACIGPNEAIHRLPILLARNADQLNSLRKKIDAVTFRQLTTKIDVSWEELAEPRQILVDHAKSVGAVIKNADAIPHDVWARQTLPKMTFPELTTLVLNQFDLTFQMTDNAIEFIIVPVNSNESFEHKYLVGTKLKSSVSTVWQKQLPDIKVKWSGSSAVVTTTLQDHIQLFAALQEIQYAVATAPAALPSEKSLRTTNYQLKAERATVGQLIDFFRSQKVAIEVVDEESDAVRAILKEAVQLDDISGLLPGSEIFPMIFGKHFKSVQVRDDRVVLSLE